MDPELWGCTIFGPKMVHFPQTIFFFFGKLLLPFLSTYKHLSLCKISKKFFQRIQSYEDAQFSSPKWPVSPNENFFRKPVDEPCFFHSCLSTSQKSQSNINLLLVYWQLKNTEIHWSRVIFGYKSRTRFFPRMQFSQNVNEP